MDIMDSMDAMDLMDTTDADDFLMAELALHGHLAILCLFFACLIEMAVDAVG